MLSLTICVNVLEILDNAIRQVKEIKGIQILDINPSLFADYMIIYVENLKDSKIIPETSKVAGYKVNIQKSPSLSYISAVNR